MMKVWNAIVNFFKKIIEWFKKLFKKKKVVIYNGKEIIVDKPTLPLISAGLDIISSIVDSNSKSRKTKLRIIDEEIIELINNLSNNSPMEVKRAINKIEEEIVKVRKEVKGSIKEDRIIKKELKRLDEQQNVLDSLKKAYEFNSKSNPFGDLSDKFNNDVDIVDIKDALSDNLNTRTLTDKDKKEIFDSKGINPYSVDDKKIDNTPKKIIIFKGYVKYTNKILKEGSKLLKNMDLSNMDNFDINRTRVEELKKKLIEIRKLYYEFKNSDIIRVLEQDLELKKIDEYEIIKSPEKIDYYLNKCNTILQTMEYMSSHEEVMNREEKKEEKKKEEKKIDKKEEKKDDVSKLTQEIDDANRMIIREIKAQQAEIDRFLSKLETQPVPIRRARRLGFFSGFLNSTLHLGLSIFNSFRNRHLSALTNGYMLNNRIRMMRRIVNPNVEIDPITFNRRIKNEIDIINNYQTICNDSLYQISSLKEEFLRCFGYQIEDEELKEAFAKLVELEEEITNQQQNLMNAKIKLNGKVKVRKFYH